MLNFHQPLFQFLVLHDPSEIILICWFITSVETVVLLHILLEPVILFSLVLWWINSLKWQHLFKMEIFSNNISLYILCIFLQYTSLLNKSINPPPPQKKTDPKLLNRKFLFWINTLLYNFFFLFSKKKKKYHGSQKILSSTIWLLIIN